MVLEMTITVQDNQRVLDLMEIFPERVEQSMDQALNTVGPRVLQDLQDATPIASGELRDAWAMLPFDNGILFENAAPHAHWVLEGTGIFGPVGQPIRPVSKKKMKFEGRSGEIVFAREVQGMRGRDFITPAFQEDEIAEQIADLIVQGILGDI